MSESFVGSCVTSYNEKNKLIRKRYWPFLEVQGQSAGTEKVGKEKEVHFSVVAPLIDSPWVFEDGRRKMKECQRT